MAANSLEIIDMDNGKMFICPDYFDISIVSDAKNIFKGLLDEKPETISLDTKKMESIDTAAMQLLFVFINDAKKKGININFQIDDDSLCRTASVLGLSKHLGLNCE